MKDGNIYILNHISNSSVEVEEYNNECRTLEDLAIGLNHLYNWIKKAEAAYLRQFPTLRGWKGDLKIAGIDESFGGLLPSIFHWYSNSLITYVRLVGYLEYRYLGVLEEVDIQNSSKRLKEKSDEFLKNVPEIKSVLIWRNKISAHLSITDAHKDLAHIIKQSVLQPISFWDNNRFTACTIEGHINDQNPNFPQWSLTQVHEDLSAMFWPNGRGSVNQISGYNVRNNSFDQLSKSWYSAPITELLFDHIGPPKPLDSSRFTIKNGT